MLKMQATDAGEQARPRNLWRIELSLPRKRAAAPPDYIPGIASRQQQQAMLYWIAEACKEARLEAERLQVHVAAELSQSQSKITRFESHSSIPEDIDSTVAAYADDLEIDSRQLWARALEMWIESEAPSAQDAKPGPTGGCAKSEASCRKTGLHSEEAGSLLAW